MNKRAEWLRALAVWFTQQQIAIEAANAYALADEIEADAKALGEKDAEIARLTLLVRLHSDTLSTQAEESPFSREEWDRVDKQTAEKNRLIADLQAVVREYLETYSGVKYYSGQQYNAWLDRAQSLLDHSEGTK